MSADVSSTEMESVEIALAHVREEIEKEEDLSVVRLIENILAHASVSGASDVHIDPGLDSLLVRVRIDGSLESAHILPSLIHHELIARLKILSGLRTDEHQAAQDGRFRFTPPNQTWIDIRVSIAPTYHGENAVLRLLSPTASGNTLDELGFTPAHKNTLARTLTKSSGMILVTGPTGSGKTTTLYTLITELAMRPVSIVTIEDPIEYSIAGVNQIQANQKAGLTFAQGLRSILRQDPDIIMVGEIRDQETAGLSVNAALTGHLVLSTLHTNDAPTTLPRLLDMKIEPYLIATTVTLVIGQRLVRRICRGCKQAKALSKSEWEELKVLFPTDTHIPTTFFIGSGCSACNESGYRGRIGIYELLSVEESLQEALTRKASAREIRTLAQKRGMIPMNIDALEKAGKGVTSLEEILRIRHE